MSYLIDSNQLLYSVNPTAPQYAASAEAIRLLIVGQHPTFVVPQTLTEFWRSATRPTDAQPQGLGMMPEAANAAVERFLSVFGFLPDTPAVFDDWRRIALIHQVRSAQVHDARLVAVMWVYGIERILTNNVRHFQRYPRIQAVTPEDLPNLLRAEPAVRQTPPIA